MKKILIVLFIAFVFQSNCLAQSGITFLYINGSNNNDAKMKNWYEKGVENLHPYLKKEFENNEVSHKHFLKDGAYSINEKPNIFFWGYKSHDDLSFVEKNLAISKGVSSWLAYQIRFMLTCFLHDAIWVQKYHNMAPILDELHESVKAEVKNNNSVVLYGYSAGSFVTYEYMLSRLPYINVNDFFKSLKVGASELDFIAKHPRKNTCMSAIGQDLAIFSISGHIVPNPNPELFKKNYLNLDAVTEDVCAPEGSVKGIINFASPLVLFYSDLSDPNFEITYYNRLLFKYIIEHDLFFITVNYRNDPLGFPGGNNLSIESLENATGLEIEPHQGFMYDQSNTWSRNSALATHTSYWATRQIFSKAVVRAYSNGYRHHYDDNFKPKTIKKFQKKFNITP